MQNNNQLRRSTTLRYTVALTLIALFSTLAFYMLSKVLKDTNSTGYVVNISGKQRMLSQHIALDAHRISAAKEKNHGVLPLSTLAKQALKEHTQELRRANTILSTGKLENGETINLSPSIYSMYFGEMNLAQRVKIYADTADKLLHNLNNEEIDKVILSIDTNSEALLKDLNKVVNQYQYEGEVRLDKIYTIETVVFVLTIIVLLLEVIFIFQPMVRKITELFASNQNILNTLEEKVASRTKSLKETEQKLQNLAFYDPLTGLRNRLTLEQDIEKSIKNYKEHHAPYAVLMFDIDWFKDVNDTYGHDMGDTVLKKVSEILLSSVREYDKVYRAGGEEFVILLNRIDTQDSINLAKKIQLLIQEYVFKVSDEEFSKTVSGGLYHSSFIDISEVKEVLKAIDTALYTSKTNGRNRITLVENIRKESQGEESINETTLIFSDKTLTKLLEVKESNTLSLCCDIESVEENSRNFKSFVHIDDIELLENIDLSDNKIHTTTLRIVNDNNEVTIFRIEMYKNNKNHIVLTLKNVVNIAKKVSDSTLIKNLHAMLDNTNDFIYFKDRNHVFTTASQTLVSVTSVESREGFVGKTDYDIFEKELADEYFRLERKVFDGKLKVAQELQPTEDNDGNKAWVDNRKYPIYDEDGTIIGLFGVARVISDYESPIARYT